MYFDCSQLTYLQIYRQADRPRRQLQANAFLGVFLAMRLNLGMVAIARLACCLCFSVGVAPQ